MKVGDVPSLEGRRARCRLFAAVLAIAFVLAAAPWVRADESTVLPQWTTKDGRVFQAKLLRLQGTAIVVARDGVEFKVPIFTLTPASLEQARRLSMRATLVNPAAPVAVRAKPVTPPVTPVVPRAIPLAPVASFAVGPSILEFCQENLGKKIGSGQCASLASAALKNAGAPTRAGADWPGEGDYVWGEPVAWIKAGFMGVRGVRELAHVEAGDIVQFHNTRFSGYNHGNSGVYQMEAKHHTAVVESVDLARATITVLHQNWNHQDIVRRQMLYLGGMTDGWLRFYHAR
ncbi:MAG: CHAP domain-containing protein [Chthoniobacter sp.]|uniref:CHAP domain-containing protein n=1 Tax=Chthoniobacter sp. TaxID=2510640 RepID=UPI0032A371DE